MLRADKIILEGLGLLQCLIKKGGERPGEIGAAGSPFDPGKKAELLVNLRLKRSGIHSHLLENRRDDPALLSEKRPEEMEGFNFGISGPPRHVHGLLKGFLRLLGQLVHIHGLSFLV